jgi:hypothetical protein
LEPIALAAAALEDEAMASFVTNTGLKAFVDALVGTDSVKYLGWGTGSGQNAASTDLATAANESRVAGTDSAEDTNTTDDTFQVTGTITAGGSRAITEVAVFDAAGSGNPPSGGNMQIYGDFSVINLASGDSITFTVKAVLDQA